MPETADWLTAVRRSHDRMAGLVGGLADDRLTTRSYADEWTVAQVASHLGSQAEIFDLFLTAGLTGGDAPDGDVFVPIWDRWNALPPRRQATESVAANEALVSRLEELSAGQRAAFGLVLFGMDLDLTGLLALRLGEHALHTWDIAVALDPAATVAPEAVALLVDTLPATAARAGTPLPAGRPVAVRTTDPERAFRLELDPAVVLAPLDGPAPDGRELRLPAEGFVRLVAGRLDADHTPAPAGPPELLDELRTAFPGF